MSAWFFNNVGKLTFGAILVLLGISFMAVTKTAERFVQVCSDQGGTSVYDGERWQCLKDTKQ